MGLMDFKSTSSWLMFCCCVALIFGVIGAGGVAVGGGGVAGLTAGVTPWLAEF